MYFVQIVAHNCYARTGEPSKFLNGKKDDAVILTPGDEENTLLTKPCPVQYTANPTNPDLLQFPRKP